MSLPFSPGARRKLGANSKLDLELWSPKKGRDHSLTESTQSMEQRDWSCGKKSEVAARTI